MDCTSTCGLDHGEIGPGFVHDKSSYYCQHLCEVCSKSIDGWVKYALETNYTLLQSIWICHLDFGDRRLVIIAHGTSSYYFKHVCQIISKSLDLLRSYGPDIQNMTHRLIIVNICAKCFQNHFKDRTRHILSNRLGYWTFRLFFFSWTDSTDRGYNYHVM
jgi:hypothetical protein